MVNHRPTADYFIMTNKNRRVCHLFVAPSFTLPRAETQEGGGTTTVVCTRSWHADFKEAIDKWYSRRQLYAGHPQSFHTVVTHLANVHPEIPSPRRRAHQLPLRRLPISPNCHHMKAHLLFYRRASRQSTVSKQQSAHPGLMKSDTTTTIERTSRKLKKNATTCEQTAFK